LNSFFDDDFEAPESFRNWTAHGPRKPTSEQQNMLSPSSGLSKGAPPGQVWIEAAKRGDRAEMEAVLAQEGKEIVHHPSSSPEFIAAAATTIRFKRAAATTIYFRHATATYICSRSWSTY
jgi:hypothetical protein